MKGLGKKAITTFVPGGSIALDLISGAVGGGAGGGGVAPPAITGPAAFRPHHRAHGHVTAVESGGAVFARHIQRTDLAAHQCGPGFVFSGGQCRSVSTTTGAGAFTGADRGGGFIESAVGFIKGGGLPGMAFRGARNLFTGGETAPVAQGDTFGEAVIGSFGMPALQPAVVGQIQRDDGSVGPILRCVAGTVLAIDDLCYPKGTKGLAAFRKWKPGARPFLSGGDRKCLLRANTLRRSKSSRRILRELGMG